ncbi:hypothetical protein [Paracoccus xiamenensis]|uniref:hypothetical protein n=1 Tax=Paracoccus xiamenensis TaxID=2714901 RepID=UPI001408B443|nr:hypothetical protein [Paracoccus xiamenensis]NHF73382.1 hypothetical protein [Paracoccus xiamenensis]
MAQPPDQPVQKQARRHSPAVIAIVVALVVVVIAWIVFGSSEPETMTDEPTATSAEPAAGTTAEGLADDPAPAAAQ